MGKLQTEPSGRKNQKVSLASTHICLLLECCGVRYSDFSESKFLDKSSKRQPPDNGSSLVLESKISSDTTTASTSDCNQQYKQSAKQDSIAQLPRNGRPPSPIWSIESDAEAKRRTLEIPCPSESLQEMHSIILTSHPWQDRPPSGLSVQSTVSLRPSESASQHHPPTPDAQKYESKCTLASRFFSAPKVSLSPPVVKACLPERLASIEHHDTTPGTRSTFGKMTPDRLPNEPVAEFDRLDEQGISPVAQDPEFDDSPPWDWEADAVFQKPITKQNRLYETCESYDNSLFFDAPTALDDTSCEWMEQTMPDFYSTTSLVHRFRSA
ncbi:hypothetical protein DL96DRAFT_975647 [Flagelloscypha sp. PMI_526]|nr:hypothetical protein DL96DRAFT_975647 [Flagelloscypha sp. PMI_526]